MRYVPGDVALISEHDEPVFVERHVPRSTNVFVRTLAPRVAPDGVTVWRFGQRGLAHEAALEPTEGHYPTFLAAAVFSRLRWVDPPRPIVYPWRYAEPGGHLRQVWTVRTPGRRDAAVPGQHLTYHNHHDALAVAKLWEP